MSPSGVLGGDGLASGLAMAAMAMGSVGLWTLRVAFAARGRKFLGAAVASLEAVVFAVAFSTLAVSLDTPVRVIGYALGVAAGTLVGLYLDERAAKGKSEIQVVVQGDDGELVERLRRRGWPATSFHAEGPRGSVTVAFVAVDDTQVPRVEEALQQAVPDAFWAVQALRRIHPSLLARGPASVPALAGLSQPASDGRARRARTSPRVRASRAPGGRGRRSSAGSARGTPCSAGSRVGATRSGLGPSSTARLRGSRSPARPPGGT